jgi:enamine deaminase RidA (YjgF/YER057c/UK114 family)
MGDPLTASSKGEQMRAEDKLKALGLAWPALPTPGGNYVLWRQVGNLLYIAGNTGRIDGKLKHVGRVGAEVTLEQGYEMARLCALNHLRVIAEAVGDLERVAQCIRLTGWVNSAPGFAEQPKVVNGASDLLIAVLGERGRHVRSAIGIAGLAANAPVETELLVQVSG